MYKHAKDQKNVKVGDILQARFTSGYITQGKLYVVQSLSSTGNHPIIIQDDKSKCTHSVEDFNILDTLPGTKAKVGDTCIVITPHIMKKGPKVGDVFKVSRLDRAGVLTDMPISDAGDFYGINHSKVLVLQQTEPELLHQKWKDLYDSGVELEYLNLSRKADGWKVMTESKPGNYDPYRFDYNNYQYRRKEKLMEITDYIINLKDSSLADRLRVRQVLLDNNQSVYTDTYGSTLTLPRVYGNITYYFYERQNMWCSTSATIANIALEDFIQKFKKSDEVRDLAFYKKSGEDWTDEEMAPIANLCGSLPPKGNKSSEVYSRKWMYYKDMDHHDLFEGRSYGIWYPNKIPDDYLQIAFEDVFPEPEKEPNEPAFEYPIYKINKCGAVQKFLSLEKAALMVTKVPVVLVGSVNTVIPHTDPVWEDWNPQFDYDTIMQPNTVVHTTTESEANELLYWAHQQGFKWNSDTSYLARNNFNKHKRIAYDIKSGSYSSLEFFEKEGFTILTMDEARNGKPKEQLMTKLSDFLKQEGVYEQFLANADVNYMEYEDSTSSGIASPLSQFDWGSSPEGYDFWGDLSDKLPLDIVRDVRAPNDIDYWEEQFHAGKEFWSVDPSDLQTVVLSHVPPKECINFTNWYAEKPTWLSAKEKPDTKEQEMKNPFKVGDKVICKDACIIGDHKPGSIETITKVIGDSIWVSNTNSNPWTLGYTWELYTEQDTCASATTETSEPTIQKKEEIMRSIENNTVEVNDKRTQPKTIQQVIEEIFGPQNATDLANKPEWVAHVFNEEEELSEIIAVDTNEAVAEMMQKECRKYFGFAVSVYRLYDTHRLAVPVTSERAAAMTKKSSKKKAKK